MATNLSSGSGLSDLTKQQDVMSRSFSPANNNRQNMQQDLSIQPEKSPLVKAEDAAETQQRQTGQGQASQQQRNVQSAAGIPEVQAMLGNLGIFNLQLNAGVNSFVNSAPFSSANAQLTAGGTPVFNQTTKMWELPQNAQVQSDTAGLVGEKLGQQQTLREMAGDMFDENGRPKTFEQVLKKFGDKNGDGVIDAQEQLWLNQAFEIVNGIRRLRNEDPYSAQAEALRAQLASKDRNGMVSGLIQALDDYDEIVNKRVTGAEADAYYLKDLLTMGQDKIEEEVQKALTASSGLFGSDYETYLQRELDKSAGEYQDAAEEDDTVMNTIKEVADAWLRMYEGEFRKAKDTLNSMFRGASDALVKDLDTMSKDPNQPGGKGIKQAMEWFVDTQTLVNIGSKEFGDIIFQALVDSPLGSESKKIIKKWLGETIGYDTAEKGVLSALLDKIATTGYFWTEDANGNMSQVYLNAQQKMDVVRIINDPSLSDPDKVDQIEGMINAMSKGMGGRLEADLATVTTPIKSGSLAVGLNNWRGAMSESFAGFDESLVQAGYGSTVQSIGRQNSPQLMQATIEQHAQKKLDEITAALNEVNKTVTELEAKVGGDMQLLQQNVARASELQAVGQSSVSQNYRSAFEQYRNYASSVGSSTVNGKPTTYIESAWVQSKGNATPPPNMVAVYAPIQAARSMVQHLKGNSDPDLKDVYSVLLRDYFGGNEAEISRMITGDLFSPEVQASGTKAARAFQDPNFGAAVFATTRPAQALAQRSEENSQMLQQAQAKLAEAAAAKARLQQSYNAAIQALQTSTRGAKMEVAQAYNAAVDGNFGPLAANIGNETANRLFNMAIEGQIMPFTSMPKIDIDGLRKTGNISYVEGGRRLDPSGLGQYVKKEFVPAGSITATSMPVNDVGGPTKPVQSRIPDTAAKTEGIPAPTKAPDTVTGEVNNRHRGEPVDKAAAAKSPVVESYKGTEGGKAAYTVNKHADGSYSGTYSDGTPMDTTAIDDTGVRFGGPLQPISDPAPVRTGGNNIQDILSKVTQGLIPKSEAGKAADAYDKYTDGKVDAALGREDTKRAATDPSYAAGVAEGRAQRQAALEKAQSETPSDRNESKENSERERSSQEEKPTNVFRGGRNQYMEQ
jgi:hypothetical protein